MKGKIYKYMTHFLRTFFGFYQRPFSEKWDKELNHIMENGTIVYVDNYTISYLIDGNTVEIWAENKWYCFAHIYRVNGKGVNRRNQYRPRIDTMHKFWNVYKVAEENESNQQYQKLFK